MFNPVQAYMIQPGNQIADGNGYRVDVIAVQDLGENYVQITWRDRFDTIISCSYEKTARVYLYTLTGHEVFKAGDIVRYADEPQKRCRLIRVNPETGWGYFEVVKKDGTADRRYERWSGGIDTLLAPVCPEPSLGGL